MRYAYQVISRQKLVKTVTKKQIFKDKLELRTLNSNKTLLEIVVSKIVSTMFTWIRDFYYDFFCIVYCINVNLEKN